MPAGGWVGPAIERGHRLRDPATAPVASGIHRRCTVAIVGAGIAGLGAARALMRRGIDDFRVFDLEDEAGGNSRGHSIGGIACPLGAHYLPVPGPHAYETAELLDELGLMRSVHGRSVYDERHLVHAPQERLWIDGVWHEDLMPPAEPGSAAEAQLRRFARLVREARSELAFAVPTSRAAWTAGHAALDAMTFSQWLDAHSLDDPSLRWLLDYACRDDYGAASAVVSAWAGLHYYASRNGFHAPGDGGSGEREKLLAWPEGNAWLVRRLADPIGDRLLPARVVRRVEERRHEVELSVWNVLEDRDERWTAAQVIVATPLHVAVRIVASAAPALREAAELVPHAPWLVANLRLSAALADKPGAEPAWDNVLYRSASLGYVDAMHQSLRARRGPTVLTAYWAPGGDSIPEMRAQRVRLASQPWQAWARLVIDDLARAHPDLPGKVERIDLMRYGHAMAVPVPGARGSKALAALAAARGRVRFGHADLSGYSVFEEALQRGMSAGSR